MPVSIQDYAINLLQSDLIKQTVDLLVKSYCESEPIIKYLNIHAHDFEPFAREAVQKAVKEDLSRVIQNKQHQVVACTLAEDFADPFIPHLAHYPKLQALFALLADLCGSFSWEKKLIKGKMLHVWLAAVDPNYRGHNLSTKANMACIEGAARKGFDYAYAEFTNTRSETVIQHFKHRQLIKKIPYSEFIFRQQHPFKDLPGAASAYVAAIRPGVKLTALDPTIRVAERSSLD